MPEQLQLFKDLHKPPEHVRKSPKQWLYRFFYGDDVFISYSRADAGRYATSLAVKLSDLGYLCYLDQLGTDPDRNLPSSLKKKIGMSTSMILIGTHGAVSSQYVRQEVRLFKETKRAIHPVDVGGALSNHDWDDISGLNLIPEGRASVDRGEPSEETILQLKNASRYRRRNQWLRLSLWGTAMFIGIVLLSAIAIYIDSKFVSSKADMDVRIASQEVETASARELRATNNERNAQVNLKLANRDADNAKELTRVAVVAMNHAQVLERQAKRNATIAEMEEKGSDAALTSRQPGREFQALKKALDAAGSASTLRILPPEQVERGLVSSVTAIDYSVELGPVSGDVMFTKISPDGSKIVGKVEGRSSSTVRWVIWSAKSGNVTELPWEIQLASEGLIDSSAFSRDGKWLALVNNWRLRLWDLSGNEPQPRTTSCASADKSMKGAALNNDGSQLLMVFSGQATLCSLITGKEQDLLPGNTNLDFYDGAFTAANEPALIGTSEDPVTKKKTPIIYFPLTQKKITLKSERERFVGFNTQNAVVTMKARNATEIHVQNIQNVDQDKENEVQTLAGYKGKISSAAIVNDRVVVVTKDQGYLRLSGTQIYPDFAALRANDKSIRAVTFSPDGRFAATVGADDAARIWDGASGSLLHTLRMQLAPKPVSGSREGELESSSLEYVAFSADSTRVVTVSDQGQIQTWNPMTGLPSCQGQGSQPPTGDYNDEGSVRAVSFFEGSQMVVVAQEGGTITFWDASSCTFVKRLRTNTNSLSFAVFSKRGTKMLTIDGLPSGYRNYSSPPPRDVKLWDIGSPNLRNGPVLQPASLGSVTGNDSLEGVITDNVGSEAKNKEAVLVTCTRGQSLTIWRPTKDQPFNFQRTFNLTDIQGLPFATISADGNRVAAIVQHQIIVWDTRTGNRLITIDADTNGDRPIALSSDGSRLIVASKDNTARVYPTTFQGFLEVGRRLAR